ncbi:MAG: prohibitin family protein [Deltaproteobacteria bacterium]|nr:prohibitin family protein [Deltaproteobacteria bacterium]
MRRVALRFARAGAVLALLATTGCLRSTGATEVGIRIGKLFGADQIVTPGKTVIVVPVLHDWYLYDTRTQNLEMKMAAGVNDELEFKTKDGNDIGVDVTVLYHVDPQQAPTVLRKVASDMEELELAVVRPLSRSLPRDSLNELSSEEFYDSDLRAAKEAQALEHLSRALAPYGVVCERVVLGNYRFHDKYQEAIDAKKVADQAVNKNRSSAEASIKEWERELETTRGQVGQVIAAERGKAQQAHMQADAYYEAKKLEADAILAEKTASAQGVRRMREAISGGGGRTMVKLKIAEALKGKRIVLFPTSENALGVQSTNVNQFLDTMGLKAVADRAATPPKP